MENKTINPPPALSNCVYCGAETIQGPYCCDACEILGRSLKVADLSQKKNPFEYLDQEDFRKLYLQTGQADYNYLFFCEGLHCSSCVHLLEKMPEFHDGVSMARVNFGQSTLAIQLDDGASLAKVAQIIHELGYTPTILAAQDDLQKRYQAENRAYLKKIAVAGFCAGNTMLFVIPVYAGLAGMMGRIFNWLSFVLFLPILFYSALPFYRGAWNSLKFKVVNVDLPITIAMLTSFALSTVNLIRDDGAIYFDSTASFMFLILSARYLLKRVQQNYLSPSRIKSFFQTENYIRISADGDETIPWTSTQRGDVLKLSRNQTLPSDCALLSSSAMIDMSLFNGESLPKNFSEGMTLFAGTKLLSEEALVRIEVPFAESKLGQLFQQLDQGALKKSRFIALTDRLAQKLIMTVLLVAGVFFLLYSQVSVSEAFNRALALVVLACPCALAFGSPLTLGLALKKAQKMGILLKDATSLERLLKIKNIFFDKTGTLTQGSLALSYSEPTPVPEDLKKVILGLENISYHPIAFALRKEWDNVKPDVMTDVTEVLGQGVSGWQGSHFYEIKHLSESRHEDQKAIEIFKDGESLSRLYFTDPLRAESPEAVLSLQKRGLNCFLLSGDKKSRAFSVGQQCHIPKENIYGELFPEDKKQILEEYEETCMIGDGANDSLGLKAASVGIAVKGSVDLSLSSADVYFTRGGLSPLFDLMTLAKQTQKILVRNLSISLVYNLIGGTLALIGLIDPLMAAILMPISSVVIVLSSVWGFK